MQEIAKDTWEAFEEHVKELRQQHQRSTQHTLSPSSPLLFRGQSDASWPLSTTLERAGKENVRFEAYYEQINRLCPEIETHTGINWKLQPFNKMIALLRGGDAPNALLSMPVYRYMQYLRHHGFPSPLLDWTRSPYIAAYFAFRNAPQKPTRATFTCRVCGQKTSAEPDAALICGRCYSGSDKQIVPMQGTDTKVSIYVFAKTPNGYSETINNESRIMRCGPYVRSHRRHFLQQSDYSICIAPEDNGQWRFAPHAEVFSRNRRNQDTLIKINIPATERSRVLKLLDEHSLNAFSLFASEESLLEMMTLRTQE